MVPFDALYTVTDPGNAVTKWTRDAFGRVRQLDEPDRGTTHYVNNGFGDVLSSTDALGTRGNVWRGRTRTSGDAYGQTWCAGIDNLVDLGYSAQRHWQVVFGGQSRRRQNIRLQRTRANRIGKARRGQRYFTARMAYDDVGHVKTLDYPQPLGAPEFGVAYDIDPHGFRIAVRDKVTKDAFWELKDVDNAGRYKEELFGNDTKTVRGYHDDKQTLKSITTTKGASTIQQLSYDWDERLNLKSRTDALATAKQDRTIQGRRVGSADVCVFLANRESESRRVTRRMDMRQWKPDVKVRRGHFILYGSCKHPHAVTNAPGETFGYDAVGNQFTRPGGVSITYTPFDLPKTITKGGKRRRFLWVRRRSTTHSQNDVEQRNVDLWRLVRASDERTRQGIPLSRALAGAGHCDRDAWRQ
jgi:YD repeat-containing protein